MNKSLSIENVHYKILSRSSSLSKLFTSSKNEELVVFDGLNLEVEKKEWVGISGKNGRGKTTLCRLIAGVIYPDSGKINKHENYLVCLLGRLDLYQFESVFLNLNCYSLIWKNKKLSPQEVKEILILSGLELTPETNCNKLSSGQHKRLLIALGIFLDFDAYIWDETFANLDSSAVTNFIQRLEGKTNIFVSHNKKFIGDYCHRVISL